MTLGVLNHIAADLHAIHLDALNTLLGTALVTNCDVVLSTTELTAYGVALHAAGDTGVDEQTIVGRLNTQDKLSDGVPVPSSCASEP